jgi:hypothetical protein
MPDVPPTITTVLPSRLLEVPMLDALLMLFSVVGATAASLENRLN